MAANIIKKILGVISLVLGSFVLILGLSSCLAIFLTLIGVASVSHGELLTLTVIMIILFTLVGVLLVLLGTYLWDWMRRRIVFGIVCTVVGGFFSLYSFLSIFFPSDPLAPLRVGFLIFGIIILPTGILLIIKQKRIDKIVS